MMLISLAPFASSSSIKDLVFVPIQRSSKPKPQPVDFDTSDIQALFSINRQEKNLPTRFPPPASP
ncbi:hypothetical protein BDV12DRAFT_51685 [Aspergillus spectabilis]